jgi:KUP system potassium uptake protein
MPEPLNSADPSLVASPAKEKAALLAMAALGVVFGDIGTSPLYALRECFTGSAGLAINRDNVLGIVSIMIWTLFLIVSVKYVLVVMRADNRGEGGILALITLASTVISSPRKQRAGLFVILGILGAALLYSDGVITPAITVLGAVEGLTEATPHFKPFIIPFALIVLIGLFLIQSRGTAKVGALFGPILLLWFFTIGTLGFFAILKNGGIFAAINPLYAFKFLIHNGTHSFSVLGSVFLCVTGAEMLFADMGHFGKKPIRLSWFAVVFPCLFLNYLGQGAYLLSLPVSAENLFYRIVPPAFLYPMVIISTTAAIIASQAVISGAYSLTRQAVQLGFWPRLQVRHTSSSTIGQVYVPFVNWCLMAGVILLVLFFRKSGNLASAYGIAVSVDMLITTVLILFIARYKWSVPLPLLIAGAAVFLIIDGTFFASNILKIRSGGWVVIIIAISIVLFMKTWIDGRGILRKNLMAGAIDLATFAKSLQQFPPLKVPGIAVFLSGNPNGVPRALLHNLKHNKVLHEHTVILSIRTEDVPYIKPANRITVKDLGGGMYLIIAGFGFSETADIPQLLETINIPEFRFDPMQTTFFLGREVLIVANNSLMSTWRKRLFGFMSHNALNATGFFQLPANRVVELGAQIEL